MSVKTGGVRENLSGIGWESDFRSYMVADKTEGEGGRTGGEQVRSWRLTAKDPQDFSSRPCWLKSPCSGEAGGLEPS